METTLAISFGIILAGLGLALIWISVEQAALVLSIRETVINWSKLLSFGPNQAEILDGDALGYRTRIQHFPGWYQIEKGTVTGSAGRVQVYPDFIARLGYEDHWAGAAASTPALFPCGVTKRATR